MGNQAQCIIHPTISTSTISSRFERNVIFEKIAVLCTRLYNILQVRTNRANKVRYFKLYDFHEEAFNYIFSPLLSQTPQDHYNLEIRDFTTLESTVGTKWWIRYHAKHEDCGNPICKHEDEVELNKPLCISYNKVYLKVSYSFNIILSFITLPIPAHTEAQSTQLTLELL
jgi:hypothetical protein